MWRIGQRRISTRWSSLCGIRAVCAEASAEQSKSIVSSTELQYKVGDKLCGYTVTKVSTVPELHLAAVHLVHDNTGAEHLHVARDDRNSVFAVAFRTVPMDSTGVPHILEHTTLCGSEKYPCRDPFFKMLTRSLSTYMNAWTFPDFTMYPFASQNAQDFSNLMAVYLDCVFFPKLTEMDFKQEGWRLEPEDLANPDSQIILKGVVYNEMKGVFSNSENLFETRLQQSILPSHTYSTSYGGDPLSIPDLTWSQLKDFHSHHYHPSNARFYTYGDQPLENHLEAIGQLVLGKFSGINAETVVPNEVKWTEPNCYKWFRQLCLRSGVFHLVRVPTQSGSIPGQDARIQEMSCPPDPMAANPDKQTTVSVAFLLGSLADMESTELLVLNILCSLLIKGPNSSFYKSLLASNIGSDYAPSTGMNGHTKEAYFAVGLQNIAKDDVERVRDLIEQTIDQVIEEGFKETRIESVLHSVELALKHETSNFGLNLVSSLMPVWNHGADPVSAIQIGQHISKFKENLAASDTFLQDKVRHYLKENQHKLTLVMSPKAEYQTELESKESQKRVLVLSKLTSDEKNRLHEDALQLLDYQSKQHDTSCLPSLSIADIPKEGETVELQHLQTIGIPLQLCPQPTNGVTYYRAISSITSLNDDLKPYVPLFCYIVTKIGAGNLDYKQMAQEIELHTGGLGLSAHVVTNHSDLNSFEQGVCFSSLCLDRNLPYMFSLWQDICNFPNFQDIERIRTLVMMLAADMANSVVDNGHSFAMTYSSSCLTAAAELTEQFAGLQQVAFLQRIAEQEDLQPLISTLSQIAVHLLDCTSMRCAINCIPEQTDVAINAVEGFLDGLPQNRDDPDALVENESFSPQAARTHIVMPFNVNYTSKSIRTVPYTHKDSPALRLLARLMTCKFLHQEIREKGGAYGGGASQGSGLFQFYSYRDPNSVETLDVFNRSVQWAMDGSFTEQDVDEAKLSVFSQIDAPVPPGSKGMSVFVHGVTDELQQQNRRRLFSVTRQNLVETARRYLYGERTPSGMAIVGPHNEETINNSEWKVLGDVREALL